MQTADEAEAVIGSILFGKDTGKAGGYPQKEYKLDGDDTVYYERPNQPRLITPMPLMRSSSTQQLTSLLLHFHGSSFGSLWSNTKQRVTVFLQMLQANLDAEATENSGNGNLTDEMRAKLQRIHH